MKNKNAVIIVRLVALMLTSSVTLFGGYLSKCITDPGVYSLNVGSRDKKRSCTTTVSTCNSCIDGWWQCFGASEGECAITVMMGAAALGNAWVTMTRLRGAPFKKAISI